MSALRKIRSVEDLTVADACPGTYVLVLRAARAAEVRIGRLGVMLVAPGWYLYVGSARGPGGLRARLAHHLRPSPRPHWHVDYLKPFAKMEEVWLAAGGKECLWAARLAKMQGAGLPMAGFGSSDCACVTHLLRLARRPTAAAVRSALGA